MYSLLPTRKMIKMWRRGFYIRERAASLHECLDPPPDPRSWRPWLLLLLLIPAVFFLCTYLLDSKKRAYTQYLLPAVNVTDKSMVLRHKIQTTTIAPEVLTQNVSESFPVCAVNKSQLGDPQLLSIGNLTMTQVIMNKTFPMVKKGGYYSPPHCHSRHKVGILVPYRGVVQTIKLNNFCYGSKPEIGKLNLLFHTNLQMYETAVFYRNRSTNLVAFLYKMHPFLMNQMLEYRIFVIEQSGIDPFNKGRLYNAGFKEMQKYGRWKCVIFHDVDLLPLDNRILYTCPTHPRHMCGTVIEVTDPTFRTRFGGVTSMTLEQFQKANGYSNMYWGWGGEDDDMFWRIRASGFHVVRYDKKIARYTALPHPPIQKNRARYKLLHSAMERWKEEGLSTVEYKVVSVKLRHLSTHIIVDVNPYNDNVTVLMSNI